MAVVTVVALVAEGTVVTVVTAVTEVAVVTVVTSVTVVSAVIVVTVVISVTVVTPHYLPILGPGHALEAAALARSLQSGETKL